MIENTEDRCDKKITFPYQNPSLSIENRIDDLLGRMNTSEKIAQMMTVCGWTMYQRTGNDVVVSKELIELYKKFPGAGLGSFLRADWYTGMNWENGLTPNIIAKAVNCVQKYAVENTRLGIPLLLSSNSIHGTMALGGVVFPTGIGCASTWNRKLMEDAGNAVAQEAMAVHTFSCPGPTQDLARDPRWSRVEETYGEDPYLSAEMTTAYNLGVRGDESPGRPWTEIRHFIAHGDPEGGHNTAPAHIGMNELFNIHMRPFEAGIKSGALSLMSSYNLLDGIPCSIHGELINGVLRNQFGYKGTVITDAGAIGLLVHQRFAADYAEAVALAIKQGGADLCCWEGDEFKNGVEEALKRGILTEKELDVPVGRVLYTKMRAGLFEQPYAEDVTLPEKVFSCSAHKKVALELARESLVLLSNKESTLPLTGMKKIAVIGPNADTPGNQLGDYTAPQRRKDIITVRDGMEKIAAELGIELRFTSGCRVRSMDRSGFSDAEDLCKWADCVIFVMGGSSSPDSETGFLANGAALIREVQKDPTYDKDSGEGYDRAKLQLGGVQLELLDKLSSAGKPVVSVLIMGRPMILNDVCAKSSAVLLAWYPGMMGGQAVAEALFGRYNPGGRLPVSIPRSEGQIPVFYNTQKERTHYVDLEGTPLFRFGYGLSYTTFEYSEPVMEKKSSKTEEENSVSAVVTNTGEKDGDEVVQMYLSDSLFSIARPLIELRGFERIHLKAGESRKIIFPLTKKELGFYNRRLEYVVEPGKFTVAIGGSLDSLKKTEFHVY